MFGPRLFGVEVLPARAVPARFGVRGTQFVGLRGVFRAGDRVALSKHPLLVFSSTAWRGHVVCYGARTSGRRRWSDSSAVGASRVFHNRILSRTASAKPIASVSTH